jgi:hypothetical protein
VRPIRTKPYCASFKPLTKSLPNSAVGIDLLSIGLD